MSVWPPTKTSSAAKILVPYHPVINGCCPPPFLSSFLFLIACPTSSFIERFSSWPPLPVLGVLSNGRRQTVRRLGPPLSLPLSYSPIPDHPLPLPRAWDTLWIFDSFCFLFQSKTVRWLSRAFFTATPAFCELRALGPSTIRLYPFVHFVLLGPALSKEPLPIALTAWYVGLFNRSLLFQYFDFLRSPSRIIACVPPSNTAAMLIDGEKYACEACVRGHRVSSCHHSGMPIWRYLNLVYIC